MLIDETEVVVHRAMPASITVHFDEIVAEEVIIISEEEGEAIIENETE